MLAAGMNATIYLADLEIGLRFVKVACFREPSTGNYKEKSHE